MRTRTKTWLLFAWQLLVYSHSTAAIAPVIASVMGRHRASLPLLNSTAGSSAASTATADVNIFLPLVSAQVKSRSDVISQPLIQDQLHIPASLTHWLKLKTWQDFVAQVNKYQLKAGESSVLVRIVGGVGIGRFLAQMGSVNPKNTHNLKKIRSRRSRKRIKKAERRGEQGDSATPDSEESVLKHYNVHIGKRQFVMSIEREKYISKQVIDNGNNV
jgi:hypothetical protein